MKKLLVLLLFWPSLSHAGTMTTYFSNSAGSITISSAPPPSVGGTYTYIQSKECGTGAGRSSKRV